MASIFDLETIATSINDALRANREGNAARRAESLNTVFQLLEGAQSAAQTRETIGREGRARASFPTELGIRQEQRKQAEQKTTLGGIDVRQAQRAEKKELDIDAAGLEILKRKGMNEAIIEALRRIAITEQQTQEAELGKEVATSGRAEEQTFQTLGGPGARAAGRVAAARAQKPIAEAQVAEAEITKAVAPEKETAVREGLKATAAIAPITIKEHLANLAATKAGTKLTTAQMLTEDALRDARKKLLTAQAREKTDLAEFDPKKFTAIRQLRGKLNLAETLMQDNPGISEDIISNFVFNILEDPTTLKNRIISAEAIKTRMTEDEASGRALARRMFSKMGRTDLAAAEQAQSSDDLIAAMDELIEDAKAQLELQTQIPLGETKSLLKDPLSKEQRQAEIDETRRIRSQR